MIWSVPLYRPEIGPDEQAAVAAVLGSAHLSAGRHVAAFEAGAARILGADDSVMVSSGTAALHLALRALRLRPGDEVIVPALTFVATAAAVALVGARPVFADVISVHEPLIDPEAVARAVGPRTRAVVAVHYAGYPADVVALSELCRRRGLSLIEDAAHAPAVATPLGMAGTVGDIGCFSFYATKNITTGEGGLVIARDRGVRERIRLDRSHALTVTTQERDAGSLAAYDALWPGLNYRPTDIAGALGLVQLEGLRRDRARRRQAVHWYEARLGSVSDVELLFPRRPADTAHHLFPVLVGERIDRDRFRAALHARGIQTGFHYPPVTHFTYYAEEHGADRSRLPLTEAAARRLVSLPLFAGLTQDEVDRVVLAIEDALPEATLA